MYAFKYERPTALADAQKSAQAGGQVLAGGQTMIAAMKQRLQQPDTLVDLAAISGWRASRRTATTSSLAL